MDQLRNLSFLLKDINRLQTKLFEEYAQHMGGTLAQYKALACLSRNEGISQIRLAELSDIDPMTLVRILDRMEADGWIERRAHPTDRRARQLYLRDIAAPVLRQIWEVGDQVRAQMLVGFKTEERKVLVDLLQRAHHNLVATKQAAKIDKALLLPRVAAKTNAVTTRKRARAVR